MKSMKWEAIDRDGNENGDGDKSWEKGVAQDSRNVYFYRMLLLLTPEE